MQHGMYVRVHEQHCTKSVSDEFVWLLSDSDMLAGQMKISELLWEPEGSWGSYLAARIMVWCDIKCDMRLDWCL